MPELGFSLQIEVYFLRGTYEFARPDHPNVHGDEKRFQGLTV